MASIPPVPVFVPSGAVPSSPSSAGHVVYHQDLAYPTPVPVPVPSRSQVYYPPSPITYPGQNPQALIARRGYQSPATHLKRPASPQGYQFTGAGDYREGPSLYQYGTPTPFQPQTHTAPPTYPAQGQTPHPTYQSQGQTFYPQEPQQFYSSTSTYSTWNNYNTTPPLYVTTSPASSTYTNSTYTRSTSLESPLSSQGTLGPNSTPPRGLQQTGNDPSSPIQAKDAFLAKASQYGIQITDRETKAERKRRKTMEDQLKEEEKDRKKDIFKEKASKYGIYIESPGKEMTESIGKLKHSVKTLDLGTEEILEKENEQTVEDGLEGGDSIVAGDEDIVYTEDGENEFVDGIEENGLLYALNMAGGSMVEEYEYYDIADGCDEEMSEHYTPDMASSETGYSESTCTDVPSTVDQFLLTASAKEKESDNITRINDSSDIAVQNESENNVEEKYETSHDPLDTVVKKLVSKVMDSALKELADEGYFSWEDLEDQSQSSKEGKPVSNGEETHGEERQSPVVVKFPKERCSEKEASLDVIKNIDKSAMPERDHKTFSGRKTPVLGGRKTPESKTLYSWSEKTDTPEKEKVTLFDLSDNCKNAPKSQRKLTESEFSREGSVDGDKPELNPHSPEFKPGWKKTSEKNESSSEMKVDAPEFKPIHTKPVVFKPLSTNAPAFHPSAKQLIIGQSGDINNSLSNFKKQKSQECQAGVSTDTVAVNTRKTKMRDIGVMSSNCDTREVCVNTLETASSRDSDYYVPKYCPSKETNTDIKETIDRHVNTRRVKTCEIGILTEDCDSKMKRKIKNLQFDVIRLRAELQLTNLRQSIGNLRRMMADSQQWLSEGAEKKLLVKMCSEKIAFLQREIIAVSATAKHLSIMVQRGEMLDQIPTHFSENNNSPLGDILGDELDSLKSWSAESQDDGTSPDSLANERLTKIDSRLDKLDKMLSAFDRLSPKLFGSEINTGASHAPSESFQTGSNTIQTVSEAVKTGLDNVQIFEVHQNTKANIVDTDASSVQTFTDTVKNGLDNVKPLEVHQNTNANIVKTPSSSVQTALNEMHDLTSNIQKVLNPSKTLSDVHVHKVPNPKKTVTSPKKTVADIFLERSSLSQNLSGVKSCTDKTLLPDLGTNLLSEPARTASKADRASISPERTKLSLDLKKCQDPIKSVDAIECPDVNLEPVGPVEVSVVCEFSEDSVAIVSEDFKSDLQDVQSEKISENVGMKEENVLKKEEKLSKSEEKELVVKEDKVEKAVAESKVKKSGRSMLDIESDNSDDDEADEDGNEDKDEDTSSNKIDASKGSSDMEQVRSRSSSISSEVSAKGSEKHFTDTVKESKTTSLQEILRESSTDVSSKVTPDLKPVCEVENIPTSDTKPGDAVRDTNSNAVFKTKLTSESKKSGGDLKEQEKETDRASADLKKLGVDPKLFEAVVDQLKQAYPDIAANPETLKSVALQQTTLLQMYVAPNSAASGAPVVTPMAGSSTGQARTMNPMIAIHQMGAVSGTQLGVMPLGAMPATQLSPGAGPQMGAMPGVGMTGFPIGPGQMMPQFPVGQSSSIPVPGPRLTAPALIPPANRLTAPTLVPSINRMTPPVLVPPSAPEFTSPVSQVQNPFSILSSKPRQVSMTRDQTQAQNSASISSLSTVSRNLSLGSTTVGLNPTIASSSSILAGAKLPPFPAFSDVQLNQNKSKSKSPGLPSAVYNQFTFKTTSLMSKPLAQSTLTPPVDALSNISLSSNSTSSAVSSAQNSGKKSTNSSLDSFDIDFKHFGDKYKKDSLPGANLPGKTTTVPNVKNSGQSITDAVLSMTETTSHSVITHHVPSKITTAGKHQSSTSGARSNILSTTLAAPQPIKPLVPSTTVSFSVSKPFVSTGGFQPIKPSSDLSAQGSSDRKEGDKQNVLSNFSQQKMSAPPGLHLLSDSSSPNSSPPTPDFCPSFVRTNPSEAPLPPPVVSAEIQTEPKPMPPMPSKATDFFPAFAKPKPLLEIPVKKPIPVVQTSKQPLLGTPVSRTKGSLLDTPMLKPARLSASGQKAFNPQPATLTSTPPPADGAWGSRKRNLSSSLDVNSMEGERWDDELDEYKPTFVLHHNPNREIKGVSMVHTATPGKVSNKAAVNQKNRGADETNPLKSSAMAKKGNIPGSTWADGISEISLPKSAKFEKEGDVNAEKKGEKKEEMEEAWCQVTKKKKKELQKFQAPYPSSKPATKTLSQKANNFERLIIKMSETFPMMSRQELIEVITEIRKQRGSLTGLPMDDIIEKARLYIQAKNKAAMQARAAPRPAAMTPPAITGFPTMTKAPENYHAHVQSLLMTSDDEDICVICHDGLSMEETKQLECGHVFHTQCITKWVNERERTCPTCRQHALFPEDFPRLGK